MTVTYTLTREDLLNYYEHFLTKKSKLPPNLMVLCGAALFCFGFWGMAMVAESRDEASVGYEMMFCSLALWGITIAWSHSRPRLLMLVQRQSKRNPDMFSEVTVAIDSVWFVTSSRYGDGRIRWQGVKEVSGEGGNAFVTTESISYIIPRTSFLTLADAEAFLAAATQYWQAAQAHPLSASEGVWPPPPRVGA